MSVAPIHWIETDLEPDDVLALSMLPKADYYVVGEGDASIKYRRMKRYAQMLGNKFATILDGSNSNKPFTLDGMEFDDLELSSQCELCPNSTGTTYFYDLLNFSNSVRPVMFSLKPMRELVHLFIIEPDIMRKILGRIELYVYGGFNFRVLKNDKVLLEMLHCFKQVHIYESFHATGERNSVDRINCPELYEFVMTRAETQKNEFYQVLLRLMANWKTHLIDEIEKRRDSGGIGERQLKILKNIKGCDFQFVLADFALVAVYLAGVLGTPVTNLRFENSYLNFDVLPDSSSSILVYKDLGFEKVVGTVMDQLHLTLNDKY